MLLPKLRFPRLLKRGRSLSALVPTNVVILLLLLARLAPIP